MKALLFLVLFFMLAGCEEKRQLPLEDEQLIPALRDVHIAENAILHLRSKNKDSVLNVYYDQICEIHGIERADLDSCIVRLKREPQMAHSYYEKVFEELEKLSLQTK